ncbi:MAG: polysaccharide deacetylase family protein [Prochlorotrichaceae cyanobacterium]
MSTVSRVRFLAAVVGIFGIVPTPVLAQSLSIPLPPLNLAPPFAQVSATPTEPVCLPKADLEDPKRESVASTASLSPTAQLASPAPRQPTWRDSLQQGANWIDRSQTQLLASVQTYGTKVLAYTQASEWPALNDRAQTAKVPVMMYHDILPEKEVFFDVTIDELREHFELIKELDLNPISLGQLVDHLHLGTALPPKPIVLTFDDGYVGHYSSVYPLLKEYGYPATFSIFTDKVDGKIVGRSTVTWEQLQEMALDPLVTIAAHSVTHPANLTLLELSQIMQEVENSKQRLEEKLGISIEYFTYPEGHYNETVAAAVAQAGYRAALTMDDWNEGYAGDSESLLAIDRFGQSRLWEIAPTASGGVQLPPVRFGFDFESPVQSPQYVEIEEVPLILITGGRPITIHADSRYQVQEILASSEAIAGVDGAFFSLEFLDSNTIIGPVASQSTRKFIPGNPGENPLLNGRPLVLLNSSSVKFVPFDASRHNSLAGIRQEMADVTDAFVGAAWLVREGQPQPPEAFGNLFDFDAARDRAFWGINRAGQPVVGVSRDMVDSVLLGELLAQAGFRDAIMLDSGASASLAYRGESLMEYIPRPVPHVVGLVPPPSQKAAEAEVNPCWMAKLE